MPKMDMTDREEAIEAIMALAAIAARNELAVVMGQGRTIIGSAIAALTLLGVTAEELATVTLKSHLIDTDSNNPLNARLKSFLGGI